MIRGNHERRGDRPKLTRSDLVERALTNYYHLIPNDTPEVNRSTGFSGPDGPALCGVTRKWQRFPSTTEGPERCWNWVCHAATMFEWGESVCPQCRSIWWSGK